MSEAVASAGSRPWLTVGRMARPVPRPPDHPAARPARDPGHPARARPAGLFSADLIGTDPAGRRATGDPRRLPDADDADGRHRPVRRRRRLDVRVRRRDARRRPGSRLSPSCRAGAAAWSALVTGIGVGVFRVHPLIMTLGMGLVVLGLANVWQLAMVQTGAGVSPESGRSGRTASFGSCRTASSLRAAGGAHPAGPATNGIRPPALRDRR